MAKSISSEKDKGMSRNAVLSDRIRTAVFDGKIDEINEVVDELVTSHKLVRVTKDNIPSSALARAKVTVTWNPLALRTLLGGEMSSRDITLPNVMHTLASAMRSNDDMGVDVLRSKWGAPRVHVKYFLDRIEEVINDSIVSEVLGANSIDQKRLAWNEANDATMNMFMDSLEKVFFYRSHLDAWVVFRLVRAWRKRKSFAPVEFQFVRNAMEKVVLNVDGLAIKTKRDVNLCLAILAKMGYTAK